MHEVLLPVYREHCARYGPPIIMLFRHCQPLRSPSRGREISDDDLRSTTSDAGCVRIWRTASLWMNQPDKCLRSVRSNIHDFSVRNSPGFASSNKFHDIYKPLDISVIRRRGLGIISAKISIAALVASGPQYSSSLGPTEKSIMLESQARKRVA